jgi:hypothetical protein
VNNYSNLKEGDAVYLKTDQPHCSRGCRTKSCRYYGIKLEVIKHYAFGIRKYGAERTSDGWCSGPQEEDLVFESQRVVFEF